MNRIAELRVKMGLTMKEAASRLERPYTTYSQAVGGEFETRIPLHKRLEFNDDSLIRGFFFFGRATFSPPKSTRKTS